MYLINNLSDVTINKIPFISTCYTQVLTNVIFYCLFGKRLDRGSRNQSKSSDPAEMTALAKISLKKKKKGNMQVHPQKELQKNQLKCLIVFERNSKSAYIKLMEGLLNFSEQKCFKTLIGRADTH